MYVEELCDLITIAYCKYSTHWGGDTHRSKQSYRPSGEHGNRYLHLLFNTRATCCSGAHWECEQSVFSARKTNWTIINVQINKSMSTVVNIWMWYKWFKDTILDFTLPVKNLSHILHIWRYLNLCEGKVSLSSNAEFNVVLLQRRKTTQRINVLFLFSVLLKVTRWNSLIGKDYNKSCSPLICDDWNLDGIFLPQGHFSQWL